MEKRQRRVVEWAAMLAAVLLGLGACWHSIEFDDDGRGMRRLRVVPEQCPPGAVFPPAGDLHDAGESDTVPPPPDG